MKTGMLNEKALNWIKLSEQLRVKKSMLDAKITAMQMRFENRNQRLIKRVEEGHRDLIHNLKTCGFKTLALREWILSIVKIKGRPEYMRLCGFLINYVPNRIKKTYEALKQEMIDGKTRDTIQYAKRVTAQKHKAKERRRYSCQNQDGLKQTHP